ncbi:MAG: branched-chain amino acid ABC transporter permease [Burkholderiales bacterium]|nr:branched-chain amino acid ABC transporter permease [Burkholderiales bacterium]
MNVLLVVEQCLNGLQFGLMLFLLAAGLTLVFGIMELINLAHGSLYMLGAYFAATFLGVTGSFVAAVVLAVAATAALGMVLEIAVLKRLYRRDPLSQVLATFALILVFNEATRAIWGVQPLNLNVPAALSGSVDIVPGMSYPAYRLAIIAVGLAVAVLLYVLVTRTRMGMLVRAGASNREMATAMGTDIRRLFTVVFGVGAAFCGLAGAMLGPLLAVQVGMGESILILAFVVVVIGGIGSIRGAFVGALVVGFADTFGRAFIPTALRAVLPPSLADAAGPSLAAISIYVVMVAVLAFRPQGLFPARG